MTEEKQEMNKLAAAVKRNRMTTQLAQQCANEELALLADSLNRE